LAARELDTPRWLTFLLANSLTLARLLAGLAFPYIPHAWRPAVVVAAAASDVFDGALSRRFHGTSLTGQLLDPIADKTFVLMVVGTLWAEGTLALWQIGLLGLREWVVLGIAAWLALAGNWQGLTRMLPRWSGKTATAAQLVYLASVVFVGHDIPSLFAIAATLSGIAAVDYLWQFRAAQRRQQSS